MRRLVPDVRILILVLSKMLKRGKRYEALASTRFSYVHARLDGVGGFENDPRGKWRECFDSSRIVFFLGYFPSH